MLTCSHTHLTHTDTHWKPHIHIHTHTITRTHTHTITCTHTHCNARTHTHCNARTHTHTHTHCNRTHTVYYRHSLVQRQAPAGKKLRSCTPSQTVWSITPSLFAPPSLPRLHELSSQEIYSTDMWWRTWSRTLQKPTMSGSRRRSWNKVFKCRPTEYQRREDLAVIATSCHSYWRYRSMTTYMYLHISQLVSGVSGYHWWTKTTGLSYVIVYVYVCVCLCECVCVCRVCGCVCVYVCVCSRDREPSPHMHISTMNSLDENLELEER